MFLAHALARPAGESGVIRTADQGIVARMLNTAVAAAAVRGTGETAGIAADGRWGADAGTPRRRVRVRGATEQGVFAAGMLRPGGASASYARAGGVGADLLLLRGTGRANPP